MTSKKPRTTYRAILCNSAGDELDFVSAVDLEILAQQLGKRLIDKTWLLAEDDVITITSGDVEQVA
jgi:hypothetical protein